MTRCTRSALVLLGLIWATLLPASVHAQTDATIVGVARSESGMPLPDARVRAAERETRSSADGSFTLRVPAGEDLRVRVEAPRHAPLEVRISRLAAGERRSVAFTLQRIFTLDAVSVVARPERPLLNTENAETGGSVERLEVDLLPADARDPLTLAFTIPGVSQSTGFFGDAPPLTIHGANGLYTRYTLDGLENTEGFLGGPRTQLPLTALERLDVHAST